MNSRKSFAYLVTSEEGLDAVFLPGYVDSGVTLAQSLRRVRPDLRLLGSNGWHDPAQLARAAADLEGLIFVDGFFADSARPATRISRMKRTLLRASTDE